MNHQAEGMTEGVGFITQNQTIKQNSKSWKQKYTLVLMASTTEEA
jgi:hypothetical protein